MEISETYYAPHRKDWRAWLEKNHAKKKEIWLVYYKKGSGKTRVNYKEALDEALCFGWIDGQAKGIDKDSYAQRFTPRTAKSKWSVVNIRHFERLLKEGLVSEAGKKAFDHKHAIYDPRAESVIYAIKDEFKKIANPKKAVALARYFKTGKGEYGYGDKFYGLTVPDIRAIAKKYADKISFSRMGYMLESSWHEERLCIVIILVMKFEKNDNEKDRQKIFDFYLKHSARINNWDLVDMSADKIIGVFLRDKPRDILMHLARSENLWERRIAIVSTFAFIKNREWGDTFKIAEILLRDEHDLIHKAVGWMLREVGKKCGDDILVEFLRKHVAEMPRTMFRYATERLPKTIVRDIDIR